MSEPASLPERRPPEPALSRRQQEVREMLRQSPLVSVTMPRYSGKTFLLTFLVAEQLLKGCFALFSCASYQRWKIARESLEEHLRRGGGRGLDAYQRSGQLRVIAGEPGPCDIRGMHHRDLVAVDDHLERPEKQLTWLPQVHAERRVLLGTPLWSDLRATLEDNPFLPPGYFNQSGVV